MSTNDRRNHDDSFELKFTDDSKSSLDVRIWGPEAWNFMQAVSFSYPKWNPTTQDKNDLRNFFGTHNTAIVRHGR